MDDLLDRCLRGEAQAWSEFVERYSPVIYAAVLRVVRRHAQADPVLSPEDAAQEVFVRLFRDDARVLRTFDPGRASLTTWLTIIAHSAALDAVRKARPRTVPLLPDVDAPHQEPPPESARPIEDVPAGLLTARERLVMTLLFDEGLAPSEAARILGVREQTIRSAKHKALTKLREHFKA